MNDEANVIAVLGVYFALMAVLAVSVEAVINWLKIPIPWLQGRPSPGQALDEVKGWLPQDEAQAMLGRVAALNKALTAIGQTPITQDTSVENIVQRVGEATTKYIIRERNRRALIRGIAALVGIAWPGYSRLTPCKFWLPWLRLPARSCRAPWGNRRHTSLA